MRNLFAAVLILLAATTAHAITVVDQEQNTINLGTAGDGFIVGGSTGYKLAQTVTVGLDGRLSRVEFPVACDGGLLVAEIVDVADGEVPGTTVRARGEIDGTTIPRSGGYLFRVIELDRRPRMSVGDRFAIVLSNETGQCGVGMSVPIDGYAGGRSVFRNSFTPAGVWHSTAGFLDPGDSAFRTYVDATPGEPPCSVNGFGTLPFGNSTPVCRCLQDPGLREFRCALLNPDFLLFRRVPFPIRAGQPFLVRWTLVPLAPLKGTIDVMDNFPAGFTGLKSPLVFFGGQVPVGQTLTLEYKAIAGKAGSYKATTDVNEGSLKTVIDVSPP